MSLRNPFASAAMILAVVTIGCAARTASQTISSAATEEATVVFLVRHADKLDLADDPGLTDAGHARADALARFLRDAGIDRVHSTDYARTRDTASPIAAELGLEVEIYDPYDLRGLADRLRRAGGRHLVVGHSNTTPVVVELLGGDPGPPIDEASEYDRLYTVTIAEDGATSSVLLRYGNP